MSPPTSAVLAAYDVDGPAVPLDGGQGSSWRAGDLVFKLDRPEFAGWLAGALEGPFDAIRVAPPVRTTDGRWGVDGWTAAGWLAGATGPDGHWPELFAACVALHRGLPDIPEPGWAAARTDPWAQADRVAWAEQPSTMSSPLVDRLVARRHPLDLPVRLVHGDLAGNVLFAPGLPPAVIDLSPYWRPVGYPAAVAVVDGLLWHDAGAQIAELAGLGEHRDQLLVRALLFRLVVHLLLFPDGGTPPEYDHAAAALLE